MIGQCLSNKNESATVSKTKKKSELNKALVSYRVHRWTPSSIPIRNGFINNKTWLVCKDIYMPMEISGQTN